MSVSDRTLTSRKSRSRNDLSTHSGGLNSSSSSAFVSDNVRQMQESLQLLFSERDRASIVQILEDFHNDRNVTLFVENLRPYIDSPIKVKQFLPCLRRVFPRSELPAMDRMLRDLGWTNSNSTDNGSVMSESQSQSQPPSRATLSATPLPDDAPSLHSTLTRATFEPDPSDLAPRRRSPTHFSWVDRYGRSVSPPAQDTLGYRAGADLHTVSLSVPPGRSLGLSIRGGAEFGLGVFVAGVDRDSAAEAAGLCVGDQLLRVNDADFELIRHDEAVRLLHRNAVRLEISLRRLGRLPYARASRPEAPAARPASSRARPRREEEPGDGTMRRARSAGRQAASFDQFQLFPKEEPGPEPLGRLSAAERETLAYYMEEYRRGQLGVDDLVLALSQLTRDAPDGRVAFPELARAVAGWARPEDQARYALLTSLNDELSTMRARRGRPPARGRRDDEESVTDFTGAAPAATAVTTATPLTSARRDCHSSCSDGSYGYARSPSSPVPGPAGGREKVASSCSDSLEEGKKEGREAPTLTSFLGGPRARPDLPRANGIAKRTASAATEVRISRAIRDIEETGVSDDSGVGSAPLRKTTKGAQTPRLQDAGVCTEPRQSRDAGTLTEDELYPVRDRQRVLVDRSVSASLGMSVEGGAGSKQPLPRIINVQLPIDGKLVIASPNGQPTAIIQGPETTRVNVNTVGSLSKQSRLGLAVQGGADVPEIPFPEIVRVEPGGAAAATGRLKVGQTILEVNGTSLHGVEHHEAAQLIARAFRNPECETMELLVMDPSGPEKDL